jgi:release factor glutamine methyltransferase
VDNCRSVTEAPILVGPLIQASGLPRSEAERLLANLLGVARSALIAHPEMPVSPEKAATARSYFRRRLGGEPFAYLLGEREFHGLMLEVSPAVLIPRPETELLVDLALDTLPEGGRVLDVGTGSGAIAIAIAHARPDARVLAVDIDPEALATASRNAASHGVNIEIRPGDCLEGLATRYFDLIVSNPPYIRSDDPHLRLGDLRYEPRHALDGGADGLSFLRRIADQGRRHLVSGGSLLMEHGWDQGPACSQLLASLSYRDVVDHADLAAMPRVIAGRWSG